MGRLFLAIESQAGAKALASNLESTPSVPLIKIGATQEVMRCISVMYGHADSSPAGQLRILVNESTASLGAVVCYWEHHYQFLVAGATRNWQRTNCPRNVQRGLRPDGAGPPQDVIDPR